MNLLVSISFIFLTFLSYCDYKLGADSKSTYINWVVLSVISLIYLGYNIKSLLELLSIGLFN